MERIHVIISEKYGTILCDNTAAALHLMDKLEPGTYDYQIRNIVSTPKEIDSLLDIKNILSNESEPEK